MPNGSPLVALMMAFIWLAPSLLEKSIQEITTCQVNKLDVAVPYTLESCVTVNYQTIISFFPESANQSMKSIKVEF